MDSLELWQIVKTAATFDMWDHFVSIQFEQEGDGPIYEHATMVTVLSLIMRSNTQMGQIWNLQPKLPWIYVHIANNFVGLLRPW